MDKWVGAAGVCTNEAGELLMVLQGEKDEVKKWAIPSGGLEAGETLPECCIREIREETGYETEIMGKLHTKEKEYPEHRIVVEVHYFLVKQTGGERRIQDPDGLIYDIAWKSTEEIQQLDLSFPEDLRLFNEHTNKA